MVHEIDYSTDGGLTWNTLGTVGAGLNCMIIQVLIHSGFTGMVRL